MRREQKYFSNGQMDGCTMEQLEFRLVERACQYVKESGKSEIDWEHDSDFLILGILEDNVFNTRRLSLNDKNIELEKRILVSDFPASSEEAYQSALSKLHAADVFIDLIIYRVGQYSYYLANPTLVRKI